MKTFNILYGLLLLLLASSSKAQNSQESKEFGNVNWCVKEIGPITFLSSESIKQATNRKEWTIPCAQGKPAWCYYQLRNEAITGTAKQYSVRLLKNTPLKWGPATYLDKNASKLVFAEYRFNLPPTKREQSTEAKNMDKNTFCADDSTVLESAKYPNGGMPKFYEFIRDNLKYPKEAKKNKIQGKVFVQFTINRDGSISDVTAIKGIGYGCDEEAVRVVSLSPKWIPAQQNSQIVKQKIVMPIVFGLK